MQQFFAPYWKWEDFIHGMYKTSIHNESEHIQNSIELLSDKDRFYESAKKMISEWVVSAKVNLTDISQNRRAWIGQATCCYLFGTPEHLVRMAWNSISEQKQKEANYIAERIISEFETKTHAKGLF